MLPPIAALLRPHQWVKNVFVFAPLVFAGLLTDPQSLQRSTATFVLFCAASSAVYVFNDIRDREEDRRHPLKRNRPLAAGTVGLGVAGALFALLALGSLAGAALLGRGVLVVVAGYLVLNLLYTLGLKQVVILDVMLVALGFVLRVLGGSQAVGVELSSWLLLCTILVALFLVVSKRRHELLLLDDHAADQRRVLNQYSLAFLDQMTGVVTSSTVVCYALYTVERRDSAALVYTVPFVLFGIFRYLYLAYQLGGERSPTEAIVRDPASLVNLALWGLLVVALLYG